MHRQNRIGGLAVGLALVAGLTFFPSGQCKIPNVSELRSSAVCRLSDGSVRFKKSPCGPDKRKLQNGDKILVEGPNGPVSATVSRTDTPNRSTIHFLAQQRHLGSLEVNPCSN